MTHKTKWLSISAFLTAIATGGYFWWGSTPPPIGPQPPDIPSTIIGNASLMLPCVYCQTVEQCNERYAQMYAQADRLRTEGVVFFIRTSGQVPRSQLGWSDAAWHQYQADMWAWYLKCKKLKG